MNRRPNSTSSSSAKTAPRQTTLFQNWGFDKSNKNEGLDEMDDQLDEETLLAACEEWESEGVGLGDPSTSLPAPPHGTPLEDLPGFDVSTGHIYIYPTNYPVRDYQYNIVQQALFKNTMVTLPTGLGKTFIAAVVMYNFYRWYPRGKIVFMAPTKPLVFQQIEACFNIMGIPQNDMAEMTGNMPPPDRKKSWQRQRVFFLTPQVMTNDLGRRACPVMEVKCVVVDEAHKALGNHAYCQVVRELSKYSSQFRVLALSATPGGDLKAVNQVLSNLLISHIEIRSEDSFDIKQYVHERKVEKIVVPLGDELKLVKQQYLEILNVYVQRLVRLRVLFCRDPASLTKFQVLKARDAFRQDPPPEITGAKRGPVEGDFALCMSLYHGFELLLQHGQRSLYSFLSSIVDGSKGNSRTRSELLRNQGFSGLMDMLQEKYRSSMHNTTTGSHNTSRNSSGLFTSMSSSSARHDGSVGPRLKGRPGGGMGGEEDEEEEYVMSHPKMTKLKEVVLEHFQKFSQANASDSGPSTSKQTEANTRVMIFAQYRDSVQEITDLLNRHWPTIRCMSFIGQASAGKNTKGLTQKEQIRVVSEFRSGGYNTLVSTCVGEEGLDIGDVDLIVCYDAHKSPIRLVQRMGRTGRKRQGRIVMLVTEGKEAAIYDRSQYSKKGIHRALQGNSKSLHLYPCSPRMVPRGLNPVPHKMRITVETYQNKHKAKKPAKPSLLGKRKSSMGGDITKFLHGVKRDPAEDVFLSYEELAFWNLHYKVDNAEQLKPPPKSSFLSVNKQDVQKELISSEGHLSMNAFTVWQTNKQPTHKVSHSKRSNNFVEMMEFIEVQGQTEDEDLYGAEMVLYLDEGDIARTKDRRKEGILRYCSQEKKRKKKTDGEITEEEDDISERKPEHKCDKDGPTSKQRKEKRKEGLSEDETCNSDDDLPVVDFLEDSEKGPCRAEEQKVKSKKKQQKKKLQTNDNVARVTRSKKLKKSPIQDGKKKDDIRLHRKAVPLLSTSDEEDFDCANAKGDVALQKQEKSIVDQELPKNTDLVMHSDGEAMDTASDEDLPELPKEPASDTHSPSRDLQTMPTRKHSTVSDTNSSISASDIFLSCSQVFRDPDVPVRLKRKDSASKPPGVTLLSGGDELMPPPPPSLSGLDLLDDIDLSFSATQLTKTDTFQKVPQNEDIYHVSPNMKSVEGTAVDVEKAGETSRTVNKEEELTFDDGTFRALQFETPAKAKEIIREKEVIELDDIFPEVEPFENICRSPDQPSNETKVVSPLKVVNAVHEGPPGLEKKQDISKQSETKSCFDEMKDHLALSAQESNGDETSYLTNQLVEAWDNFEGDIFADDDDVFGNAADTGTKSNGAIHDCVQNTDNSSSRMQPESSREESGVQKADKISAGIKVSVASHDIKLYSGPTSVIKNTGSMLNNCTQTSTKQDSVNSKQKNSTSLQPKKDAKDEVPQRKTSNISGLSSFNVVPKEEIEQPKFDLDFDFGDFFDMDDEAFDKIDVVPPSPQINRTRPRFMALSQASLSTAGHGLKSKKFDQSVPAIQPGSHSSAKASGKDVNFPQTHPADIFQDNQQYSSSEFTSSELQCNSNENGAAKTGAFRHGMKQPCHSPGTLGSDKCAKANNLISPELEHTRTKRKNQPPAASTPVSSAGHAGSLGHHASFLSPIGEPNHGLDKDKNLESHQETKPIRSLRSRLSTKSREVMASEGAVSFQDNANHVKCPSLSSKRKSSPLVAEGHFEDDSSTNPMKKHKAMLQDSSSDDNDMFSGPKLGLGGENDGINSLLQDIEWEDSLHADVTLNKDSNKKVELWEQGKASSNSTSKKVIVDDGSNDESDDDIGRVVKKTRRARVLISPDTPSTTRTPVRPKAVVTPTSCLKVEVSDDDLDDSSFITHPKKRKARKILDTSSLLVPHQHGDDDDDDFEVPAGRVQKPARLRKKAFGESSLADVPLRQRLERKTDQEKPKKKLARRRHRVAHFLDEEAEVSDDEECSSDEDIHSDSENSLDGFINNASQLSQNSCAQDMHAIYMKSVRSPVEVRSRFKMVHRSPDMCVFSQVPQQDATYMEDSFVVQGDEDEDGPADEDEEISMVAMENTINLDNIVEGRKTRAGRTLRSKTGESRAAKILRAGRAAVLKSDSSSSEAEVEEDKNLMDWEIDFEESRMSNPKNHRNNYSGKKWAQTSHQGISRKSRGQPNGLTSNHGNEWLTKPHNTKVLEKDSCNTFQTPEAALKAPLKTNYALMNAGESSTSRQTHKPCTFVAPQPPPPQESQEEDSQTLAQREKEERLRKQRQKQAEFLQKMREKKATDASLRVADTATDRRSTQTSVFSTSQTSPLKSSTHLQHPVGFRRSEPSQQVSKSSGNSANTPNYWQGKSRLVDSSDTSANESINSTRMTNLTMMNNTLSNATMSTTAVNGAFMNRTLASPGKSSASSCQGALVILVDSKELASAPHIVSTLTITHRLNPVVSQLQGCDYVTSTRMGVEKRTLSEFSLGANRQKLLERVRHMCELFDRPCLIIEKDRVKAQDKKQPRAIPRTKYLDATLAALSMTHVKILFSDSTEETAQILSDLVHIESRKGVAIPAIPDLDTITEQVLKFYQSIPGVSYVTALSLIHHFPSIQQLVSSCESILQSRIKLSSVRAKQIMSYINHCFDEQMTGSR